jgi:hypothetical protein
MQGNRGIRENPVVPFIRYRRVDGAFKREVTLKLPMLTRVRKDLEQRFAREREILASLEHLSIARLHDAGTDSTPGLEALEHSGDRDRSGAAIGLRDCETPAEQGGVTGRSSLAFSFGGTPTEPS